MAHFLCFCVSNFAFPPPPHPFFPFITFFLQAEKELQDRREQLEKMTDVLKAEMARVTKSRRQQIAGRLVEFARAHESAARARADAWQAVIPAVNANPAALEVARESVTVIARKAEAKARAASQAAKQRATGQAGASVVAAAGAGGGAEGGAAGGLSAGGSGGMFDEAPIPSAAEL